MQWDGHAFPPGPRPSGAEMPAIPAVHARHASRRRGILPLMRFTSQTILPPSHAPNPVRKRPWNPHRHRVAFLRSCPAFARCSRRIPRWGNPATCSPGERRRIYPLLPVSSAARARLSPVPDAGSPPGARPSGEGRRVAVSSSPSAAHAPMSPFRSESPPGDTSVKRSKIESPSLHTHPLLKAAPAGPFAPPVLPGAISGR